MKTEVSSETSPSVPDRRRHVRYRYSIPIQVHSRNGGSVIRGMSLEISESGMSAMAAALQGAKEIGCGRHSRIGTNRALQSFGAGAAASWQDLRI